MSESFLRESCDDSETQRRRPFRSDAETGSGADVAVKERREEPQGDTLGAGTALRSDALQSSSIQDSDGGGGSVGRAARPDELSLPRSSAGEFPVEEQPLFFKFFATFAVTAVSFNVRKLQNVCPNITAQILTAMRVF